MTRVPYTVNVDEYVCTELERLRKAYETRDFSSVLATVERIQVHVSAMENALHREWVVSNAISKAWDPELSDEDFRKQLKKAAKKKYKPAKDQSLGRSLLEDL